MGTEKLERGSDTTLPWHRCRADGYRYTRGKAFVSKIIPIFKTGKYSFSGTQMLAKGLDFDNVGIVGIIAEPTTP